MKFKLFTVFDRESKTFDRPFAAPTERDAKAGFAHAINNKETNFGQFPEDFDLYLICAFDPRTGKLEATSEEALSDPQLLCTGKSLLTVENKRELANEGKLK